MDQYEIFRFKRGGVEGVSFSTFCLIESYNHLKLQLERHRLFCGKADQTISNMTLEKEKYITGLIGPCPESELVQRQTALGAVSMCQITKFATLVEKVKYLMANGKFIF